MQEGLTPRVPAPRVILAMALLALTALYVPRGAVAAENEEAPAASAQSLEKGSLAEYFPFFPSLLNSVDGKPIPSSKFISPLTCRDCHADIYNQWRGSMHANARFDPVFVALWRRGAKEAGEEIGRLCSGCHAAVSVLSGEVVQREDGSFDLPKTADYGVHCHVCHSVVDTSRQRTPTGMPQNASLVLDPSLTMRGPFDDARPLWHEAAYSELHTSAEFCGNCHNIFHPVNNFHIENTYTEWKFSVYAQKGIICQDCHMMPVEKAIETARTMERPKNPGRASPMGPMRENIFTHEFVGGNFTVPGIMGHEKTSRIAEARLKSAATIELLEPARYKSGDIYRLQVKVTNVGAGHNLPTSLTEVRQMWVDLKVADAEGKVLYRSGQIGPKGEVDPTAHTYGAYSVDEQGSHTVLPWKIVRFERMNTIPPKGSATENYAFFIPPKTNGPLTVEARLRYRSLPQALADELLGEKSIKLPVVDMAEAMGKIAAID